MTSSAKPILVTGAHRSGTTWVGKMLALAPGVGYVHEPFNPRFSAGRFDRYFTVVTRENGNAAPEALKAQAIAARTFVLRAMLDDPHLGTPARPIENSERFQTYAAKATEAAAKHPDVDFRLLEAANADSQA